MALRIGEGIVACSMMAWTTTNDSVKAHNIYKDVVHLQLENVCTIKSISLLQYGFFSKVPNGIATIHVSRIASTLH